MNCKQCHYGVEHNHGAITIPKRPIGEIRMAPWKERPSEAEAIFDSEDCVLQFIVEPDAGVVMDE